MYYFHRPALLKKSLFKRTLKTLTGVFVLKVGISATLLALATTANSAGTQVAPFTYGSWQTSSAEELDLPNLRGQGLSFAEQYENKLLGEWSLRNINSRAKMEHDPWIYETIKEMTWRLNAQARQQAPLGLVIIDNPSINAFAAPGGVIGLNTGTILAASSMDELASVVAHEVAHISQHHYESGADERKKALLMQIGGMLAAIAASAVDGDAAAAVMMGSQTATMNSSMAFSRSNERDADRVGMQIMNQAGYDPRAMPRFFATMNQKSQLNQTANQFLPSFVRSHPLSNERLSESQSRAQRYDALPLSKQQRHQALFDLLYWRTQSTGEHVSETALTTAAKNSVGAKLALMYWYGEQQRFGEANEIYTELSALPAAQRQVLEPLLSITQSQILTEQNKWQQAAELLESQQRLYPERRDLRLYLAEALTNSNQPAKAQALLKPLTEQQPSDRYAWQSLQLANEKIAKTTESPQLAKIATINALRYRSHDQLWSGHYERALTSLTQAKQLTEQMQKTAQASSARPLLASINAEIKAVKTAKDFKP
ncbi:M48 family metallopeptidase [Psychrobacter faecalis]|uniref:M48 family metallopeptidase n=1 Tax=Psychrobacter faecalis TaxID=180588 RepID=UPI0007F462DD|nr:M48 family metalloprotease [Psychrobacter faecalis]MBP8816882.1 M48 family metalloprotease [Psychrobacter sp.]OAP70169.1 peptidase M48, Ste24p [Psychrobacter sp. SHUES1]HCR88380.1 peptidase M48, Ste24p [Psychrobacter sp.]